MPKRTPDAAPAVPATGPEPTVSRGNVDGRWLSWRRLELCTKRMFAVVMTVVIVMLGLLILVLTFQRHTMDLQPITVPKALAKAGFTDQVVTQRLADEIRAIPGRAKTSIPMSDVQLHQDLADITIPQAGISVYSTAAAIRRYLVPDSWKHEVSGEFTLDGAVLSMRVRINGRLVFAGEAPNPSDPAPLIKQAALDLVKAVDPYIAALALVSNGDLPGANALVDEIIDMSPPESENLALASYLKGVIAVGEGHEEEAKDIFDHLQDRSMASLGMGQLQEKRGRLMDAADAYRNALLYKSLDRVHFLAYNNLGNVLTQLGEHDAAKAQYREAIRLDPKDDSPYVGLGNLLRSEPNEEDDAIAQYRKAIRLDPTDAMPHSELGRIWAAHGGKENDAIAEFRMGILRDPRYPEAYYDLGQELLVSADLETARPKKVDILHEACQAFIQASKLAPADPDYSALMQKVDKQLPEGHCVAPP